jgi:hypothetical protein
LKTKLPGERDVQNVVSSDERVAVFILKLTVDVFLFYRDKEKKNVALASVVWRDSLKTRCFYEKRRQSVRTSVCSIAMFMYPSKHAKIPVLQKEEEEEEVSMSRTTPRLMCTSVVV